MTKKILSKDANLDEIKTFLDNDKFNKAVEMGKTFAQSKGYQEAPVCIDKLDHSADKVVLSREAVDIYNKMCSLAKRESDTVSYRGDGTSLVIPGSHFEYSFCMVGQKTENGITINNAFFDKESAVNSVFNDPDYSGNFYSVFANSKNTTSTSASFDKKMHEACETANDEEGSTVVIYGHTHPQLSDLGKINNYPSATDVELSVTEAHDYYKQEKGNCTFLNAIVNADGDINIFGYDIPKGEYVTYNKLYNSYGDKIPAYTEGNYPLQETTETQALQ